MTDPGRVVLRSAMYIAYAHEIVGYAADMLRPVDRGASEEIRALGRELHDLIGKVRAAGTESGPEPVPAIPPLADASGG